MEPGDELERTFRVVVAGESGVGKSTLLHRIGTLCAPLPRTALGNLDLAALKAGNPMHLESTIGVGFTVTKATLSKYGKVKLQLWDTAGQERFNAIVSSYFRDTDLVLLIYDVQKKVTFERIELHWIDTVHSIIASQSSINARRRQKQVATGINDALGSATDILLDEIPMPLIYLIGNKTDLTAREDQVVTEHETRAFCTKNGVHGPLYVSALGSSVSTITDMRTTFIQAMCENAAIWANATMRAHEKYEVQGHPTLDGPGKTGLRVQGSKARDYEMDKDCVC